MKCSACPIGAGMRSVFLFVVLVVSLILYCGCANNEPQNPIPAPPMAQKIPKELTLHGHTRIDNYFWMEERDSSEVIEYLKAENDYTQRVTGHTENLQKALYGEISERYNRSSVSLLRQLGDNFYYLRWEAEKEHPIFARRRGSLQADEEKLIDVNDIAQEHSYTSVPYPTISPDQNLVAFGTYADGNPASLRFKDLDSGRLLDDVIQPASANVAWCNDSRTLFYAKVRSMENGPKQIYRHVLGTDPDLDELVHEETEFRCLVWKRGRYIVIESFGSFGQEWRYLDADQPDGKFEIFTPRELGHEYSFWSVGDYFYIRTNHEGAQNFKLMRTHMSKTRIEHWEEVISHRDDVLLEDFRVFRKHLVVAERKDGRVNILIHPLSGEGKHSVDFGESVYSVAIVGGESESNVLRCHFTSFTTPNSIYDYNMDTREKKLVWQQEVLGGFNPEEYVSERIVAPARDGIQVPVSLVYRKEIKQDGMNPLLMYAYASGGSIDAEFNAPLLSLLDRGFIYAIAHVRGGEELGRQWYEDGRLLKKMNTFTDFIDAAVFLVEQKYSSPDRLFAQGASSGGLLMGVLANMRPDLFRGIVAQVPWVDVLAEGHGDLGDPNDEEYYWYMHSYSPYENVKAHDYPNMLVTAGFYDNQVPYSQPARWVAKLRAHKTNGNLLLLKTNMEGAHGGPTGRSERWKELAFMYAFLLDLAGIEK
jgi:oligopeptidase B